MSQEIRSTNADLVFCFHMMHDVETDCATHQCSDNDGYRASDARGDVEQW